MRPLTRGVCIAIVVGAGARAGAGQTPPFKSGVTLVTIDVTALDRDGRPVPDLSAADFEVKLNGRVQTVRAATFLRAVSAETMAGAVGPTFDAVTPATAPRASSADAPGTPRMFVILVDDLSFLPTRGRGLFNAAQRFVAALPATDRAGLATTSGTRVVNPTADRAPVLDGLAAVVGAYSDPKSDAAHGPGGIADASPDQAVGVAQALAIERGDSGALEEAVIRECFNGKRDALNGQSIGQVLANSQCATMVQLEARRTAAAVKQNAERQLQAYRSVIRAMQPAPGIRHLVLITDGVGLWQDVDALAPVTRAAAEAGVQVSVIMERADPSAADAGRRDPGQGRPQQTDLGASQRRREDDAMFLNGARTVADNIGASFYHVVGSPDPFFERVGLAASAVYRLAVEPPRDTAPGRDFALSARIKRAGITAIVNCKAIAGTPLEADGSPAGAAREAPAAAPLSTDEQLRNAIATGRAARGIEMSMSVSVRRADDPAQVSVDVAVEIDGSATAPLDAILGLVEGRGTIKTTRRQIEAGPPGDPYRLAFSFPVAPGAYKVRFAAADASGLVSAVETSVNAQLSVMGPLAASDLLRSTIDAVGHQRALTGEVLPKDAKTLLIALELYASASAAPPDVLVRIALAPEAGDRTTAIERVASPESRDGALIAEAEFPLERLAPGRYIVRATVLSGASVLGSVSTAVRR